VTSSERVVALNDVGLVGDVLESTWQIKFDFLLVFKMLNGLCDVCDKALSRWFVRQRKLYWNLQCGKKSSMTE